MATVGEILDFVEALAPESMKMDWDNVGLLLGSRTKPVTKILVALDPFEDVAQEAADWGAELIVTHHPLFFRPARNLTDESGVGRTALLLAANGISAINAHTNLDCAPDGVNDVLARTLGLENIRIITPSGVTEEGREWGLLRMGTVPEQSLDAFLATVKAVLHCPGLRYAQGGKSVHRVAVGGGACADEMAEALAAGCDTFVTADVKYNQFWDAADFGLNLIDAGHFYTENPVCGYLAEKLRAAFPAVSVKISQSHQDCMKFF